MRVPAGQIPAPPFPRPAPWINVAMLRLDQQRGRPVVVEFWDHCRPSSVRSVRHLAAWHERYAEAGLRVVGVHAPGFPCSRGYERIAAACERLGVTFPVLVDDAGRYWDEVGVPGWPARYLFDGSSWLVDYHYGEGGYRETEIAILEILGLDEDPLAPLRPVDDDDALIVTPTVPVAGPYVGPYRAGEVWATLEPPPDGEGGVLVDGRRVAVDVPGAYLLVEHEVSTEGEIAVDPEPGTTCHEVSFAPGLAVAPD